jgi:hypothetical protein
MQESIGCSRYWRSVWESVFIFLVVVFVYKKKPGGGAIPAEGNDVLNPDTIQQQKAVMDLIETDLFAKHMPSVTYLRMDGSLDPVKVQYIERFRFSIPFSIAKMYLLKAATSKVFALLSLFHVHSRSAHLHACLLLCSASRLSTSSTATPPLTCCCSPPTSEAWASIWYGHICSAAAVTNTAAWLHGGARALLAPPRSRLN